MKWLPLVLLAACASGDDKTPDGTEPDPPDTDVPAVPGDTVISAMSVAVDPDHPTIVHVTFQTDAAVPSYVRFGHDGAFDRLTPDLAAATEHVHQLRGLKASHRVSLQAVVVVDGEEHFGELFEVDIPAPPADLPPLLLTHDEPGSQMSEGGYVMMILDLYFVPDTKFYLAIADKDGDWVWWHAIGEGLGTSGAYLPADGQGIIYPEYDIVREDLAGNIVRMELDGDVLSVTNAPGIHHALAELPGGRFAYLDRVFIEAAPDLDGDWIMTDGISIVPEGDDGSGAEMLFDYYVDWWDSDIDYYWTPLCDFEQLYASVYGYPNVCDVTHSNSIAYVEADNALYSYARRLDTMLKVDLDSGDLQWQMSGLHSDFTYPDGSPLYLGENQSFLWSQGHFSHVWGGGMMLFDNGNNHVPQVSALAEYAWDEQTMTVEEVWRYADPQEGFTASLGDARKLASGHVLASWMSLYKVNEISPEGELLWQLYTGETNVRRINYIPDLYDLTNTGER